MRKSIAVATACALAPVVIFGLAGPAMAWDATYFAFGPNWTVSEDAWTNSALNVGELGQTSSDSLTSPGYVPPEPSGWADCYPSHYQYNYSETRFAAKVLMAGTQETSPKSSLNVILTDPATGTSRVITSFNDTLKPYTEYKIDFDLTWGNLSPSVDHLPHVVVPDRALKITFQMNHSLVNPDHNLYVISGPVTYISNATFKVYQPCHTSIS